MRRTATSSSSEAGNIRGAVSTYFDNRCSISAPFQAVVKDRAGTAKHGPTSTEWRLWRDRARHGQSDARVRLARSFGNVVPISCSSGKNAVEHLASNAIFLREE